MVTDRSYSMQQDLMQLWCDAIGLRHRAAAVQRFEPINTLRGMVSETVYNEAHAIAEEADSEGAGETGTAELESRLRVAAQVLAPLEWED
jgi:hypothetical protein